MAVRCRARWLDALPPQRELFAVPADVAYFNTATMAPQLHRRPRRRRRGAPRRGEPWNITDGGLVRRRRATAGPGRDGCSAATPRAWRSIPATSYGFAVAARNLQVPSGTRILVLADEYPSGIYTWRRFAGRTGSSILTVERPPDSTWTDSVLAELDERVSIVSVPNVHWTDGALLDLVRIADRAHEVGARLVIDASQSLGVLPIDVERAPSRRRDLGGLQVAARALRPQLPVRRRGAP